MVKVTYVKIDNIITKDEVLTMKSSHKDEFLIVEYKELSDIPANLRFDTSYLIDGIRYILFDVVAYNEYLDDIDYRRQRSSIERKRVKDLWRNFRKY